MIKDRGLRGLAMAGLVALGGCAVPPMATFPPRPVTARDSSSTAPVGSRLPPATPGAGHVPAAIDSGPSREALQVLATIPEPLTAAERVAAPPAVSHSPSPAPAPGIPAGAVPSATPATPGSVPVLPDASSAIARDTTAVDSTTMAPPDSGVTAPSDSSGAQIPVPERTPVLGEHQNPLLVPGADTTASGAPPASAAPAPAAAPPAGPAPASPVVAGAPAGTECWRVQIVAPRQRAMADTKLAAAQSLLLTPMVLEYGAGLWKIRTRDCLDRDAADRLRGRAVDSGFSGAFLIPPGAAPVGHKVRPPAPKPVRRRTTRRSR